MKIKAVDRAFRTKLLSALRDAKSVCLTTHVNPDGDGLAACLALKRIFAGSDIKADIVVDDLDLERYEFLQVMDNVIRDCAALRYDLVVVIDLHDNDRLGDRVHLVKTAAKVIVIDHHEIDNDMLKCDFCLVDTSAVCTGWIVYTLFRDQIDALPLADREYVGNCLYTTILNDTNNFTNANTDAHAFELAQAVCHYGVKPHQIQRIFMVLRSSGEMRLLGQVLSTIELYDKGKVLFMDSSLAMLEENNLSPEATSNFTRWVQDLKGVETVAYFREESPDVYRLSLRSKVLNMHAIAIKYNGGGHLQASGCVMNGKLTDLKNKILADIHHTDRINR